MILRDYQREAIDDVRARWKAGARRVPIVLATGLGKTVIFTTLISEWLAENPGKRALIVAHTNELIEQAAAKMRAVDPSLRVGIVKGTLNATSAQVVVSSRQTLASVKRRGQLKRIGLIVIDECHHAHSRNTYGAILRHFGALAPEDHDDPDGRWEPGPDAPPVLGVTATLVRGDKAKLSTVWEECTFKRDMMFGIRRGFLSDVRGEQIIVPGFDLDHVKTRGADYADDALAEELERTFAPEVIAREYARLASDRKGIVFWPLVATAEHGARAFAEEGITSAVVHGAMPLVERKSVLARFRAGEIQTLHNAMVLTEGFDDPEVEAVVIARRSKSAGLIQQMAGRGLRQPGGVLFASKRPCLIMVVASGDELPEYTFRALIDLSPESVARAREEHPEGTLEELDEYARAIEGELEEARAGATLSFESEEYAGATATRAFDPLARDKAWGRTREGTYYLSAKSEASAPNPDAFVFCVDSLQGPAGTYDLVMCSKESGTRAPGGGWARGTEHRALSLEMALSWGEELAGEAYNTRKASWRRRPASDKQRAYARSRYRISGAESMLAGELHDAIDQAQADWRIDPLVAAVRAKVDNYDQTNSSEDLGEE